MTLTRRQLLHRGAAAGLGLTVLGRLATPTATAIAAVPKRFSLPLAFPPERTERDIVMIARQADVQLLDGAPTRLWTFDGSFPGPTIRRPSGEPTTLTVIHELGAEADSLTIHHHGAHTPAADDGGPAQDPIAPGARRTYTYPLLEDGAPERAALQWYHDHTHFRTGRNVWRGLFGLFIVEDEQERSLNLPSGPDELVLSIADRTFDAANQLTDPFTAPGREARLPNEAIGTGYPPFDENVGGVHLVNGVPQPFHEVGATTVRLRVLNASGFRPYNLALSNGTAFTQIGTESGLLPEPITRSRVLLGPGERADLLVDLSALAGQNVTLLSVPRTDVGDNQPHTGAAVAELMQLRVRGAVRPGPSLPASLTTLPAWAAGLSTTPDRVLAFGLGTDDGGRVAWTVNGREFDHERVDFKPELGATETWALVNSTPYGVSHYIHLHDVDWVVLQRNGATPPAGERGALKETFRIEPGEVVLVGTKFTDHTGPYMAHCHMLDHEDHGMMARFDVVPAGQGDRPIDPLAALPAGERACVADLLAQVRRRPGRPATVRLSPGSATAGPAAAAMNPLICDLGGGR